MSKIRSIVKLHNIFHEQAPSIGKKKEKCKNSNYSFIRITYLVSDLLFKKCRIADESGSL